MDKYYEALYDLTHDEQVIAAAGWIDKPTDVDFQLDMYTTPVEDLVNAPGDTVSILLYPGCFAPVHEGHLTAMRLAKEAIENTGETVVAGYFTPDHDDYVMRKTHDKRFRSENRIAILNQKIQDTDWMKVDPWAARYAPTDLNFTTLYERLTQYVARWVPGKTVKVYLVFGGDNYLFANTFVKYGYGVCIPRLGADTDYSNILPEARERIVISEKVSTDHSSTAVRAAMDKEMATAKGRDKKGTNYVLRNDLSLALPQELVVKEQEVADKLEKVFATNLPDEDLVLLTIAVEKQMDTQFENEKTISLDSFWKGDHNFEITRLFENAGHQLYSEIYTHRPGSKTIEEQLAGLTPGEYILVDDDIATGTTMKHAQNLLEGYDIVITKKKSLIEEVNKNLYDVVDLRDFIIGTKNGGLTVSVGGKTTRVPYMLPYVNLATRARLSPFVLRDISKTFWEINRDLYAGTNLTVKDIQKNQDFTLLGFEETETIESLCQKHIDLFS